MQKTENYQLPQWEANDEVRREDFNGAMASIDTAIQSASYVIGSYTGNGKELSAGGLRVELGFKPRFLLITKGWYMASALSVSTFIRSEHPNDGVENYIELDDTGFTVGLCSSVGGYAIKINVSNITYDFVALR